MIAPFQIAQIPEIRFGWGCRQDLAKSVSEYASVVLISSRTLAQPGRFSADLLTQLQEQGTRVALFLVSGEPSPEMVDNIVEGCPNNAQAVIGIGGGSVLDTAKAVAGLIPSGNSVMNYLEGVGKGEPFDVETLPFIAVPTTAGTGSETTKNAVLSRLGQFKKSFRDNKLLAKSVWLDPELLMSCPQPVLYSTGMDAFTQLLESYTTLKANPVTNALAWQGMTLFKGAFELLESPSDADKETGYGNLMLAASLSGITLANAGLGAVHGLAGPIGAFFEAPHGIVCAKLLAPITAANIETLQKQENAFSQATLHKYARIGRLLTDEKVIEPSPETLENDLSNLISNLQLLTERYAPISLSEYGMTPCQLDPVIENCRSGSMLGNPVVLSDQQLQNALYQTL
ncbi:iron-containing alcohol dehydrogenase [Hydrogenovibrio sp. JE_KL2]|uniref:iron-containing alcohol dehydrogenase n=1 Tax=Hydrogenovibrio sp. JE_KL2 TaxID=2651188 RepID=UPI00128AE984|nr:iron-containing alcohol dehydrogenase [Hydrogenovibrio sp. JE_KL2]MPQ77351.1 iron-containing alcohol dehydrogenase [Hydrogenovibrio sp. JE_KL2]